MYCNDTWTATYTVHDRRVTIETPAQDMARNTPKIVSLRVADIKADAMPLAADARPSPVTPVAVHHWHQPRRVAGTMAGGPHRSTNDIFPEGPIGDVMRQHC